MSPNQPDQFSQQPHPMNQNAATMQFATPGSEQSAPKKKQSWKKWGGITVGALIVIGVAGNLGGGDEDTENTAATESSTTRVVTDSPESKVAASEPAAAVATQVREAAEEDVSTDEPDTSDSVPAEYTSALREAQNYDRIMNMSKQGLSDQLTSEYGGQFSDEAAQYAVDHIDADWNANALAQAESYQDMNLSPAGIHDQLTSAYGGQFTTEQADYALANLNGGGQADDAANGTPVEYTSALAQAETYASMDMSKQGVHDQLASAYGGQFSAEAARYAIDNIQWDWNANALASARTYQDMMNMSPAAIHDQLTSPYGGQFTTAEADYAIANL